MRLNIQRITDGRVSTTDFILRYVDRYPRAELQRIYEKIPPNKYIVMWNPSKEELGKGIVWIKSEDVLNKMLNELELDDNWEVGLVLRSVLNQFLDYQLGRQ